MPLGENRGADFVTDHSIGLYAYNTTCFSVVNVHIAAWSVLSVVEVEALQVKITVTNDSFAQFIVYSGERLWPSPARCLDTVADGMRMQQLAEKTWPIALRLAEKDVFTIVRLSYRIRENR